MYHGTEIERGRKIVKNQKFDPTISTDRKQHWLGDGIYLYREDILAFRWIVMMYNSLKKSNIEQDLLKNYSILKVDILCDDERIFRFDNPEHLMVFKKVEAEYKKKSIFSKKLSHLECTDGLILNIMFKNLGYGNNYDMVEANFETLELDSKFSEKTKFKSFSEYQACVKNDAIIKNIQDIGKMIDINDFFRRYNNIENTKQKMKYRANGNRYFVKGRR